MGSMTSKRTAWVSKESYSNGHRRKLINEPAELSTRTSHSSAIDCSTEINARQRITPPLQFRIVAAQPGEHVLARQLLVGAMRGPSQAEFQAQLDDPYYEPSDRLFCKVQDAYAGHVRIVKREMRFGSTIFPIGQLADLLILPEFRQQGCGAALLAEAEKEMKGDGAVLGMLRTNQPNYFLERGWCVWTRHSFSMAGPREILSRLLEAEENAVRESGHVVRDYNIRLWRHIERPALVQLYEANTRGAFGALVRTEAYWNWLLSRQAFDRIYVAIDGPERYEFNGVPNIVGYAVMREGRILELMVSPERPDAAPRLLARACSDAIEQDAHYVRLDAPVGDPLHHVMARAGGELGYHEAVHGEVCLVKVLDPVRLVELLGEQLSQRARDGGFSLPLELGIHFADKRQTFEVRNRSARVRTGRSCRSYLECSASDWAQLLLGHLDPKVAMASQRVIASTRVAAELACVLFPKLPLWRPPWDELPAQ